MTFEEITREMAKLYHAGLTLDEVGQRFGMTRQGVRERFIKAGIDRRQPSPIDKDRLEQLYLEDRLPIDAIAAVFVTTPNRIRQKLKKYKIPRRPPLKIGGSLVDFLRKLKLGQTDIIKRPINEKYANIHSSAKQIGITISIRSLGGGEYSVTRVE